MQQPLNTTIRAALHTIGHLELHNDAEDGEPIELTHAIVLIGETDEDVRALAPILLSGTVSLRVELVEEPGRPIAHIDMYAIRRTVAKIVRAAELEDASVSAQTWASELIDAGAGPSYVREPASTSDNQRKTRELVEHSGEMSPLARAKSLDGYRHALRRLMHAELPEQPATMAELGELAAAVFDLIDITIATLADGAG